MEKDWWVDTEGSSEILKDIFNQNSGVQSKGSSKPGVGGGEGGGKEIIQLEQNLIAPGPGYPSRIVQVPTEFSRGHFNFYPPYLPSSLPTPLPPPFHHL